MVMRVAGLATGMDIERMVNKLMEAERMPLQRMQQDQTKLEWKRDAYRDINRVLFQLDELMFDMKMSKTYRSKNVMSSQESAITATVRTSSSPGSYSIQVKQLASAEMHVGKALDGDLDKLIDEKYIGQKITFKTFDESSGKMKEHSIDIEDGDTIGNILTKITNEDNNVRAFYEPQENRVILESTRTGKHNNDGNEIVFEENSFFTNVLKLDPKVEIKAKNAKFIYNNGLELESKTNSYELNGVNLQFHDVTNGSASITVSKDIDHAFDSIVKFVDQYNQVVEAINASQQEEVYRDYLPLTKEQMEEMSEKQIELWEEKAKSGILRGENALSTGLYSMRQTWYSNVENDGAFSSLTNIGITTSENYFDGGKLVIDEERLREALQEDMDSVEKLLSDGSKGESKGLINRLEDSVKNTMKSIERQAGKDFHTLDNYTLGKRMKQLNDEISDFEARMVMVENRYWNQFTQMETAIQRLNEQSSYLFSQFGGGM